MSFRQSRRPSSESERDRFAGFRVYVGDIGQRMNKTDLEREFGQYGPVTDVWMGKRREPQQQNYAFIVYRYPEDADEAVRDRNGRKVLGRKVRVEHAKPVNSNARRQRGGWNGGGGRGNGGGNRGNYYSQRRDMPQRRSRERHYSRRSSSESPERNARSQQSPTANRRQNRNDSYSDSPPKKIMKRSRSSSESPERRHQKPKKSRKQASPSQSPPPASRSNQQIQDSDTGSLSPTPPPKKKKKKKQRAKSIDSPQASNEYDARHYQKQQAKYSDGSRAKSSKSKKEMYVQGDYSSDEN